MRPTRRVKVTAPTDTLLSDGFGTFKDADGYYYAIIDYGNGFNGCVNPEQFFNGILAANAQQLVSLLSKVIPLLKQLYVTIRDHRSA